MLTKHYGPLNEKQQQYIEEIANGGEQLLNLIVDLLDVSTIDSGITVKNQKHLAVTGEAKDGIDTVKKYADRFET